MCELIVDFVLFVCKWMIYNKNSLSIAVKM